MHGRKVKKTQKILTLERDQYAWSTSKKTRNRLTLERDQYAWSISQKTQNILALERDQYAWSRSQTTSKNINVRARSLCIVAKSENTLNI